MQPHPFGDSHREERRRSGHLSLPAWSLSISSAPIAHPPLALRSAAPANHRRQWCRSSFAVALQETGFAANAYLNCTPGVLRPSLACAGSGPIARPSRCGATTCCWSRSGGARPGAGAPGSLPGAPSCRAWKRTERQVLALRQGQPVGVPSPLQWQWQCHTPRWVSLGLLLCLARGLLARPGHSCRSCWKWKQQCQMK